MPILNGNYIDLLIIVVLIYFVFNAFRFGFWILAADFLSFLTSLFIAFNVYKHLSYFLKVNFNLTQSVSDSLGFLISAILIESVIGFVFSLALHKLPEKFIKHKFNKLLGVLPAMGEGLVLIAFVLTLVMSFPVKPQVKVDISKSKIGGQILDKTAVIENSINQIFGQAINDTLTYLTVRPDSDQTINLDVDKLNLNVDSSSEVEMTNKINTERRKIALNELVFDEKLAKVARDHATDMWQRKYFSHYSPEGYDLSHRLKNNNIVYLYAGENLALAPTVQTAHSGLMNSKGHRENILSKDFNKVGVGVIDNGVYGKMFVQVFSN